MVLRRSLAPTDHESYTKYVAAVYEKQQQQALSAAQPQSPASAARSNASRDNRVGISIEHLLRCVSLLTSWWWS